MDGKGIDASIATTVQRIWGVLFWIAVIYVVRWGWVSGGVAAPSMNGAAYTTPVALLRAFQRIHGWEG